MASEAAPPSYMQEDGSGNDGSSDINSAIPDPQILIVPADSMNFQKGFLGADGERAAVEGEVQIKGLQAYEWAKLYVQRLFRASLHLTVKRTRTVSLRTVESAYGREIELNLSEIVLHSASSGEDATWPSFFPFSIPLTPDTPQSIRTPHSSLSHTLTATLHPHRALASTLSTRVLALSTSIQVPIRRFTAHSFTPVIHPETHRMNDPTEIQVEVPRNTFKSGESILVYVTIPPPARQLVVDQGLRLRNMRVELLRMVQVKRSEDAQLPAGNGSIADYELFPTARDGPSMASSSALVDKSSKSSSKEPESRAFAGASFQKVITHSGASCRFHSTKPVRLRFVLHQTSPSDTPSDFDLDLPSGEFGPAENNDKTGYITQTTLLHSVSFQINVHVSFVDMSTHMERFSTVSIPIIIAPPPAALPEVDESIDVAYQKKHDRPPVRTVRHEDRESSVPHYEEGQAGPSFRHSGAPPPFEERDAPPPFSSHVGEASTSTRLPTFLESETEIIVPDSDAHTPSPSSDAPSPIIGEGVQFGFLPSDQFDGHSEVLQRSSTPPPTLEMASLDTDLTDLTDMEGAGRAMEALSLALDHQEENGIHPPPPPAMDDPSDPPPSIDSEFRAPSAPPHPSSSPPRSIPTHPTGNVQNGPPTQPDQAPSAHGHAPPPYLGPGRPHEHEQVARPPPYMG